MSCEVCAVSLCVWDELKRAVASVSVIANRLQGLWRALKLWYRVSAFLFVSEKVLEGQLSFGNSPEADIEL